MWNTYQMFVKKILAVNAPAGIDGRYPDKYWTLWRGMTFKARSHEEAMKKADKFLRGADIHVASMIVKEIPNYLGGQTK